MEDDFGKTRPNINLPKGDPEPDFGQTMPNIRSPRNEPEQDFSMTMPNVRMPVSEEPERGPSEPIPPQQTPQPQPTPQKKGGVPGWVWALVGVGAFLFIALVIVGVALWWLWSTPGFTVIIEGAPPNSTVYVDGVVRSTTTAKGNYEVRDLRAGIRNIRVSCDGYTDFADRVDGKDGEVIRRTAKMARSGPVQQPSAELPAEIDYKGRMVLVKAGEFEMGSEKRTDEKPIHKVTLPDYYIDKFEVTNAQFKLFCDETGRSYPADHFEIPGYFQNRPNAPVLGITWDDAQAYAKWAGKRLATEQEWEKAASWDAANKKKRQWPWGETPDSGKANLNRVSSGDNRFADVGKFAGDVSPYGVMDMAGNASEWVENYYQPYPENTTPDSDYGTANRVIRGGNYQASFDNSRTTRRLKHTPFYVKKENEERSWLIGFRCVVSANDPELLKKINSPK
jgi:formylglycine-generating enzyme required for sulfatase activity